MIDLRSDTVTKPTAAMRHASFEAIVGDDVYGEDPTVRQLEETAAEMLGKEAALFVTSGTGGNQIAVLTHCRPGNEILLESDSHIFYYEGGAISALAGVQPRTITGVRGEMNPEHIRDAIRGDDIHLPETGLICLENTHNRAGGAIVSLENMKDIYDIASSHRIPVHLDGARLFNAAVGLGHPLKDFAQYTTTIQVCLSKGLGAPVGSILAGSTEFITRARKWRKRLGGGLRQAGIIAAPGLVALTTMVDRLAEDHENCRFLADEIANIPTLSLVNKVETNIVLVDVAKTGMTSEQFLSELEKRGVLAVSFGKTVVRFMTHYDVNKQQLQQAIEKIAEVARLS